MRLHALLRLRVIRANFHGEMLARVGTRLDGVDVLLLARLRLIARALPDHLGPAADGHNGGEDERSFHIQLQMVHTCVQCYKVEEDHPPHSPEGSTGSSPK